MEAKPHEDLGFDVGRHPARFTLTLSGRLLVPDDDEAEAFAAERHELLNFVAQAALRSSLVLDIDQQGIEHEAAQDSCN